jgi:archaellum biogenesis protein FlaJ (TadC family)
MHSLVMPLILIFTVSNAIAPTIAEGGSKLKILNNLAVTAAISGISLLTLPALADTLFKTTSQM